MAVDFDFDTSYNDEDEDENQVEEEVEGTPVEDAEESYEEEEEEGSGRSNLLRLILLILLILVLLCGVCWIATRFFDVDVPIPGLGGAAPPAPTQAVVPATATPAPVSEEEAVTDESAVESGEEVTEAPAGEEGVEAGGAEAEELPSAEAEEPAPETEVEPAEPVEGTETEAEEAEEEAIEAEEGAVEEEVAEEETIIILTPSPVPGPTATPSPGEADQEQAMAATDCTTNTVPVADAGGPYTAIMGKGQAIVTFDGSGSSDADGTIESFGWDFGDGSTGEGEMVKHGYTMTGTYTATLTIVDNCGDSGEDSAEVTITAAQTPPDGDDTENGQPDPDYVAPPVDPALGTLGFCYQVQRGDTLSGIANTFGVPLPDLAYVNGVSPQYYVIAGQGLFVPVREINPNGPNIYQVQPGDTMHSIAYLCGISVTGLARANGTHPDTVLAPGQIVRIPPPWSY